MSDLWSRMKPGTCWKFTHSQIPLTIYAIVLADGSEPPCKSIVQAVEKDGRYTIGVEMITSVDRPYQPASEDEHRRLLPAIEAECSQRIAVYESSLRQWELVKNMIKGSIV